MWLFLNAKQVKQLFRIVNQVKTIIIDVDIILFYYFKNMKKPQALKNMDEGHISHHNYGKTIVIIHHCFVNLLSHRTSHSRNYFWAVYVVCVLSSLVVMDSGMYTKLIFRRVPKISREIGWRNVHFLYTQKKTLLLFKSGYDR